MARQLSLSSRACVPGQLYDRPYQDPETYELSLQPRRYLGVFRAPNGWLVDAWGPVEERESDDG